MQPHVHMSTSFLFFLMLFFLALVAIIFAFVQSMRNDRREAEIELARINRGPIGASGTAFTHPGGASGYAHTHPAGNPNIAGTGYAAAPVMMAPGYSGADLAVGMMAGAAIGGAFGHHNTVIVNDGYGGGFVDGPGYCAPVDSGFSYDSGGSSYDSGGGGCDVSFGGGD